MQTITQGLGALMMMLGMGSSLTSQYMSIHQQMQAQKAQQQSVPCPTNTTPTVMIGKDGTRTMVCVQESGE